MGQAIYEMPTIHCDLRQEEMIIQIADALDYLNNVVSDMLQRIESKISSSKMKLNKLKQRVAVANVKVNELTGSKKAIRVLSSAKYPAKDVRRNYESIFSITRPLEFKYSDMKVKTKHHHPDASELQDRLQFFHVKVSSKVQRRNMEIAPEEGLGSLPSDVDSISSLLLFNTSVNPYKRYVMVDPLAAPTKSRQVLDEDEHRMEAAPLSISQREQPEPDTGENYFYSPVLGEVPQIDLPLDLPDLPGVADDLSYATDSEPTIAPSATTTPAMSDLPGLRSETPISTMSLPELPPVPSAATTAPELVPSGPPLFSSSPANLPQTTAPPPPPPPPPPTLLPGKNTTTVLTDGDTHQRRAAYNGDSGTDVRANLMEAIRKAGGSKNLSSVKDMKFEAKEKKNEEKKPGVSASASDMGGGGDFLVDLHAKLALRRKGISGAKTDSPDAGVMSGVSAMIPSPEAMTDVETANAEYSDDDNDYDWD